MSSAEPERDLHLDSYLQASLATFEHEVRARFDDTEAAKAVWALSERFANLLHEDASALAGAGVAGFWGVLRGGLADHPLQEELEYGLQTHLAWALMPSFAASARRCWDLGEVCRKAVPSDQVQRFLRRVSRCYLLGLEAECLIMCRGAFENALTSKFRTEGVAIPDRMKDRLDTAGARAWLDPAFAEELRRHVWIRGSKAAHADPEVVGGSLETIDLTVRCLGVLNAPFDADA